MSTAGKYFRLAVNSCSYSSPKKVISSGCQSMLNVAAQSEVIQCYSICLSCPLQIHRHLFIHSSFGWHQLTRGYGLLELVVMGNN